MFCFPFVGYEDGQLTLYSTKDVITKNLKAFERLVINVSTTRNVYLSSNINVNVIATVNLTTTNFGGELNKISLYPYESHSHCSFFMAFNCSSNVCGYIVVKKIPDNFTIYNKSGVVDVNFPKLKEQGNSSVTSFEVTGLSNGYYFLQADDDTPFVLFEYNSIYGRYTQTMSVNSSNCYAVSSVSNLSRSSIDTSAIKAENDQNNESFQTSNITSEIENENITGAFNETESYNVTSLPITYDNKVRETAQNVPKVGPRMYLTSNSSTSNDSTVVQQIDNRLIFPFMYEEIPEDDNVLNEYLIAVIVSLCTAICAVIGVISTFLLLEFLRRRRHVGNTKIRPFVS